MIEVSYHTGGIQLAGLTNLTAAEATAPGLNGPTLALHGWLDNAASFLSLLPLLTERPVIALDLPGHGLSAHRSPGAAYYFVEWVADIVELIEQQNWQQVHLLGHSMGGFISQLVASVIPERIQCVTLIEGFGLLTFEANETREKLAAALQQRRELAVKKAPVYSDKERIIRLRAETSAVTASQITPVVERNLYAVDKGWSWRVDPRVRLGSPFRYTLEQADDLMAGIKCPVQLIRGESGFKELDVALLRWSEKLQDLQVCTLPGGHHVHLECPIEVALQINAFLQQHG